MWMHFILSPRGNKETLFLQLDWRFFYPFQQTNQIHWESRSVGMVFYCKLICLWQIITRKMTFQNQSVCQWRTCLMKTSSNSHQHSVRLENKRSFSLWDVTMSPSMVLPVLFVLNFNVSSNSPHSGIDPSDAFRWSLSSAVTEGHNVHHRIRFYFVSRCRIAWHINMSSFNLIYSSLVLEWVLAGSPYTVSYYGL